MPQHDHHPIAPSQTPSQALQELKAGYQRYLSGETRITPLRVHQQIKAHAQDQKPFAVILACADSRVPPGIVFDQDVGDLFVLRVAGNVADTFTLGSIQYAIEHLGTRLIVVLGHERCGAITAALSVVAKQASFSGPLGELVSAIAPLVEPAYRRGIMAGLPLGSPKMLDDAVRLNVRRQVAIIRDALENLGQESMIRELWLKQILVVGARYDLDDGKVDFLDEASLHQPKRLGLMTRNGMGVALEADGSLTARSWHSITPVEVHEADACWLAFKCANGHFLSSTADGVAAKGPLIGDDERFRFLSLGSKHFVFQDFQGRFLSHAEDGRIVTASEANQREFFQAIDLDG